MTNKVYQGACKTTVISMDIWQRTINMLLSWLFMLSTMDEVFGTTVALTNVTTTTSGTTKQPSTKLEDLPKAVITVVSLAVIVLFALIIAKLAAMCYERNEISDNSSDISEHTRELLKMKMTIMTFRATLLKGKQKMDKKTRKKNSVEYAKKYANIWRERVKERMKRRRERIKSLGGAMGDEEQGSKSTVEGDTSKQSDPPEVTVVDEVNTTSAKDSQEDKMSPTPVSVNNSPTVKSTEKNQNDNTRPTSPRDGNVTPKNVHVKVQEQKSTPSKPMSAKKQGTQPLSAKSGAVTPTKAPVTKKAPAKPAATKKT